MRDYSKSSEIMERIINKYNSSEKIDRYYGTNTKLSRSEIHTINVIGKNPDISVTEIAKIQGITKGAVSQMISKLIKKGFITKSISKESEAKVCLGLTETGIIAFNEHKKYHEKTQESFFKMIREMSDEKYEMMIDIMESFESLLDSAINNHLTNDKDHIEK